MLVGFFFTFLLPETAGKSLETIISERDNPNEELRTPETKCQIFFQKCFNCFGRKSRYKDDNLEMTRM